MKQTDEHTAHMNIKSKWTHNTHIYRDNSHESGPTTFTLAGMSSQSLTIEKRSLNGASDFFQIWASFHKTFAVAD